MYEDNRRISLADLPGLIEGAHMNHGMGHYFLKHVERTKVLIVVVDINGFKLNLGSPFRDAFETTVLLNKVSHSKDSSKLVSQSCCFETYILYNCCDLVVVLFQLSREGNKLS